MRINVCTPTRGKNGMLLDFVGESIANSILPDTKFVLGFDNDMPEFIVPEHWADKVIVSRAAREDALGAKYNRCGAEYQADLYVMGLDDVAIATPGWDDRLAHAATYFCDGIGVIYFGDTPNGEALPSMMAVTRTFVDIVGFFCPPFFPFWWNNTWVDEIAMLANCIVRADIKTRYPVTFDKPPRRDILFWAKFFDDTRPMRARAAAQIMTAKWTYLIEQLELRNSRLRNPAFAGQVEEDLSKPDNTDARHERLKAQAMRLVA